MDSSKTSSAWLYITCVPSLFALLGIVLTSLSYTQAWGGGTKLSYVLAVFFAEISIVISAAGLLAYYFRIPQKTKAANVLSAINWFIVFSSVCAGLYLFLS